MSSCTKCGDRRRSAKRVLALQGHELDPYEQMPDDQIQELEHNQFIDLVDNVLLDLERMEAAVKRRQELYDRLRKVRLADMLAANQGKVAEATEMLFQLTEVQGSVSWANVVKTLKKAKPELEDLLTELEEQHRGKPSPRVLKYRRKDEPKTWKQLEHVPLRHSAFRRAQGVELDEMAEYRMLRHMGQALDALINGLDVAMRGGIVRAAGQQGAYKYSSHGRRRIGNVGQTVMCIDDREVTIGIDDGFYEGTKPEYNTRKIRTIHTLNNLGFMSPEVKMVLKNKNGYGGVWGGGSKLYPVTTEEIDILVRANQEAKELKDQRERELDDADELHRQHTQDNGLCPWCNTFCDGDCRANMRGGIVRAAGQRPNAYDEYEYDHLVDDIHDIEDQIEQLEEMGDASGRIEDLWEDLQDAEEMLRRYRYDSGGRV